MTQFDPAIDDEAECLFEELGTIIQKLDNMDSREVTVGWEKFAEDYGSSVPSLVAAARFYPFQRGLNIG